MMYILHTMMFSLSMYTLIMLTPMTLGITILGMAMIMAIMFALINSSWMAFLIFLIYISGTLIMFAYFVAMAPNTNMTSTIHMYMMFCTPMLILFMLKMFNMFNYQLLYPTMNTFFNMYSMMTLIIMIAMLLITMIIVVKVSSFYKGPLRPFNYV